MKKYLSRLKFGISNSSFPVYAQYINSIDDKLIACNDEVYISVDKPVGFTGSVNFFVLENFLKTSDSINMKQKNNTLLLSDDRLRTSLPILQYDINIIPKPDIRMVPITKEIYDILILASKFVGGLYSSLCIEGANIYSTDGIRLFYTTNSSLTLKEIIGLDRKVLSFLKVGDSLGIFNNKVVVEFEGGYAIFTMDNMSRYPTENIDSLISDSTKNLRKLCSVQQIQSSCQRLSPIFFGEQIAGITITNRKKKALIVAESLINGKAEIEIETDLDEDYEISMDSLLFKGIPDRFDIFTGNKKDMLVLKDTVSTIFLMGLRK